MTHFSFAEVIKGALTGQKSSTSSLTWWAS